MIQGCIFIFKYTGNDNLDRIDRDGLTVTTVNTGEDVHDTIRIKTPMGKNLYSVTLGVEVPSVLNPPQPSYRKMHEARITSYIASDRSQPPGSGRTGSFPLCYIHPSFLCETKIPQL